MKFLKRQCEETREDKNKKDKERKENAEECEKLTAGIINTNIY